MRVRMSRPRWDSPGSLLLPGHLSKDIGQRMLEWRRPDTYTAALSSWNGGTEPLRDISQGVLLDAERPSQPDPRAHRSIHGAFSSTVPRLLEGLIGQLPLQHPQCAAPRRARHLWIADPRYAAIAIRSSSVSFATTPFINSTPAPFRWPFCMSIQLPEHIGGGPADDTGISQVPSSSVRDRSRRV